ncbi:MAG TPA: hypothetical protein VGN16_09465 [Acidobacteriaceae bacterium]|jgi:hypothetical protein
MSAPQLAAQIQGQASVSADNLNTYEQTCDNLSQLAAFVGLPGIQVFVRGFSVPGDGGQGVFYWAVGNYTNDGVNTIVPSGAASGAWLRLYLNAVVPISSLVTVSGTTIQKGQWFVPIDNTTGAAFTINMPLAPANGETHTIKDWLGNASTHTITIFGNGSPIDGATSFVMDRDYQSVSLTYAFGKWGVW